MKNSTPVVLAAPLVTRDGRDRNVSTMLDGKLLNGSIARSSVFVDLEWCNGDDPSSSGKVSLDSYSTSLDAGVATRVSEGSGKARRCLNVLQASVIEGVAISAASTIRVLNGSLVATHSVSSAALELAPYRSPRPSVTERGSRHRLGEIHDAPRAVSRTNRLPPYRGATSSCQQIPHPWFVYGLNPNTQQKTEPSDPPNIGVPGGQVPERKCPGETARRDGLQPEFMPKFPVGSTNLRKVVESHATRREKGATLDLRRITKE